MIKAQLLKLAISQVSQLQYSISNHCFFFLNATNCCKNDAGSYFFATSVADHYLDELTK